MGDAIQAVIFEGHFLGNPPRAVRFHRLFRIVPNQPYAVAITGLAAQLIGKFEQQSAGGTSVVGAHVGRMAQRIVRIVVTGNDDDAVFCARMLGDDVVHRKLAFWSVGGEGVVLDLISLQVRDDVLLDLLVTRAAHRTRAKLHNVLHILHRAIAVERGRRPAVGRERERRTGGVCQSRSGSWRSLAVSAVLVVVAREHGQHCCQQNPPEGLRSHHSHYACACFSFRAWRCLGCTIYATPMLSAYKASMGAAKTHMFTMSGVGVTIAARTKMTRIA